MSFERVDTKSPSEAVEVLFSQAIPSLPVISIEDIRRICENDLNYNVRSAQRHVTGAAEHLRPIIAWNLEKAPAQLYSGQRVIGYEVTLQPKLKFAALTLFIGDASGTPGYAFGARVWRTTQELFVQGWEGFQTAPPGFPLPQQAASTPEPVDAHTDSAVATESEALIAKLRSESWEIRAAAAELLGERQDQRALDALIRILEDKKEDTVVKESAAEALRTLGDARGVASVEKWEYSGRPVFMTFGPDDPDAKRRRDAAARAKAKVQEARITLQRELQKGVPGVASQGSAPRQRPWWRFWSL